MPSRPMLLCFDGNSASVWQDVDPILARLGLKALLLLRPDQLSLTSPYYVTSSELHRLVASGRWELGLLVTPKIRVRQTRAALNDLASGRLDAHAALAFSTAPAPARLARFASLRSRFRIVLADTSTPRYAVAGDRGGALPRVGLPRPSTTLSELGRLAPRPPQADAPLRQRAVWRAQGGAPRPVAGVLRLAPKPHTWQASLYAPQTSAAWDNYRLHVRITGLSKGNTASVLLRVAGDRQLSVSISSGRLSVRATNSHATQVLATARLHTASVRTLSATLHGSSLQVESGSAIVRVGVPAGNDQGGVGLGGWRLDDRETLTFEHLRIAPA